MLLAFSLTVTLGWWIVPAIITAIFGFIGIKICAESSEGWFEMSPLVALLCAIPPLLSWTIYFGILAAIK